MKNLFSKTRDKKTPYEVWKSFDGQWSWSVLKKYQNPEQEAKNEFARWFCFVTSPFCPHGEFGDVYIREIQQQAQKVS